MAEYRTLLAATRPVQLASQRAVQLSLRRARRHETVPPVRLLFPGSVFFRSLHSAIFGNGPWTETLFDVSFFSILSNQFRFSFRGTLPIDGFFEVRSRDRLLSPMSIVDLTSPLFWPINTSHKIQTDAKLPSARHPRWETVWSNLNSVELAK